MHDAWIVGSAAAPEADLSKVNDIDVLVPWTNWKEASTLLHEYGTSGDLHINTFGGWKVDLVYRPNDEDYLEMSIDVWPGDLAWLFTNDAMKYAWHFKSGTRVVKI